MKFDLAAHTILLTISGSRAYGTHTQDSDVDVKGIAIPPVESYVGLNHNFEQADSPGTMNAFLTRLTEEEREISKREKLEGTVYELRKFLALAADANPNILEVLFCDDTHVRVATKDGQMLRDNRELFLTAKAKHTLSGYSAAQFKRLKAHRGYLLNPPKAQPTRAEFGLPQSSQLSKHQLETAFDIIKKRVDGWELDLGSIESDADRFAVMEKISESLSEILTATDSKWKCAARLSGFDESLVVTLDKERRYRAAQDDWARYTNWKKNRNPARAALEEKFGMDCKHASHLVRLMRNCKEVLLDGKLNVNRTNIDADELLAIRNGSWTYDRLAEFFETEDARCAEIYNNKLYKIPHHPDMRSIEALCVKMLTTKFGISQEHINYEY